jgi:hypothetical protein
MPIVSGKQCIVRMLIEEIVVRVENDALVLVIRKRCFDLAFLFRV